MLKSVELLTVNRHYNYNHKYKYKYILLLLKLKSVKLCTVSRHYNLQYPIILLKYMFTLNITCMTLSVDKPSIGVIWERCGQAQYFQLCQVTLSGSLSRLKNISLSFFSRLMIKYKIVLLINFQFGPIGPFCRYQVGT